MKVYTRLDGKLAVFESAAHDVQSALVEVCYGLGAPEYRNYKKGPVLAVVPPPPPPKPQLKDWAWTAKYAMRSFCLPA